MKIEIKAFTEIKRGLSTFLVIAPVGKSYRDKFGELEQNFNFLELDYDLKDPSQVLDYADKVIELLEENKVKSVSIIGLEDGGALAQAVAVRTWRILRRLVLLDSFTRLHPTWFEQLIDRIEAFLPLGLPMRSLSSAYDSRCELHRIQCPTLILRSTSLDSHLDYQAELLHKKIPNSWLKEVKSQDDLCDSVEDFEKVPAKRPQK